METKIKLIDLRAGNSFSNKKGEIITLTECIGNDWGVFFEYDYSTKEFTTKENKMEVGEIWAYLEKNGFSKSNK